MVGEGGEKKERRRVFNKNFVLGCHFISSQIICDVTGRILAMDIGFEGHNNDQGNWLHSTIGSNPAQFLAQHERILADKGY
jgi:hypothetical protein